jgi:hypothetical protein
MDEMPNERNESGSENKIETSLNPKPSNAGHFKIPLKARSKEDLQITCETNSSKIERTINNTQKSVIIKISF